MSVHDDLGWLADERALLRAAVESGRPVLGVCLGAQQLAAALGAPVTEGPAPEYGVGEVHLTAEAARDPVFGPAPPRCPACTGTVTPSPCPRAPSAWPATRPTRTRPSASVARLRPAVPRRGDRQPGGHWGPHLPSGVYLRESDVAHVSREGEGILRRFVGLAGGRTRLMGVSAATVRRLALPTGGAPPRHDLVPGGREDLRHHAARRRSTSSSVTTRSALRRVPGGGRGAAGARSCALPVLLRRRRTAVRVLFAGPGAAAPTTVLADSAVG